MKRITNERLAEIDARANGATERTWTHTHGKPGYEGDDWGLIRAGDGFPVVSTSRPYRAQGQPKIIDGLYEEPEEIKKNAEFVAHARTDIPDLVAEVRRLQAREG